MKVWAEFSARRVFRYELGRVWDEALPLAMFIGLNPSTADETHDDPTIRRCIGFARSWGAGGILMGNIFAYRSTDPHALRQIADPLAVIGEANDTYLRDMAARSEWTVAAWGVHGALHRRGEQVASLIPGLQCLGRTKQGFPRHPLYLRADTPLEQFA